MIDFYELLAKLIEADCAETKGVKRSCTLVVGLSVEPLLPHLCGKLTLAGEYTDLLLL